MMKREDNDRLTRVGPGTPGGEMLRRYWIPALLSHELPEHDGAPMRVRLLAEDLIAFRDSAGKVGLVEAFCPHRRAPMFYGRNEENGLRCVYHGWKFDHAGNCVDMPSEPAGTPMKDRVKIRAYPTVEKGGLVWAYLGPREQQPAPPDYEFTRPPATHRHVSKTYEACNWLQGMEGGFDTAHTSFLHNDTLNDPLALRNRDRTPQIEVQETDYGYYYVSNRKAGELGRYVRANLFVMPFLQLRGAATKANGRGERIDVPRADGHIWVPIDDEQTFVYNTMYSYDPKTELSEETAEYWESFMGRGKNDMIPGTFRLKQNAANNYLQDRQRQKTHSFTGIPGINTQDFALQEGMGKIVDRTKENLGTSDKAIVMLRRMLLEAIAAVERGEPPRGVDPAASRNVRPYDKVVRDEREYRELIEKELVAQW